MPTNDDRPLRDVLREVEEAQFGQEFVFVPKAYAKTHVGTLARASVRLVRELRAVAPLLREAALTIYINRNPGPVPELVRKLRALADELEAGR